MRLLPVLALYIIVVSAQLSKFREPINTLIPISYTTGCESIETTLRTRRLLWAGTLLRMSGGRLPKPIMFGNLEGAVRRGRGGKEEEWTDCVQSDIRAFGITGDWKTMALKAEA